MPKSYQINSNKLLEVQDLQAEAFLLAWISLQDTEKCVSTCSFSCATSITCSKMLSRRRSSSKLYTRRRSSAESLCILRHLESLEACPSWKQTWQACQCSAYLGSHPTPLAKRSAASWVSIAAISGCNGRKHATIPRPQRWEISCLGRVEKCWEPGFSFQKQVHVFVPLQKPMPWKDTYLPFWSMELKNRSCPIISVSTRFNPVNASKLALSIALSYHGLSLDLASTSTYCIPKPLKSRRFKVGAIEGPSWWVPRQGRPWKASNRAGQCKVPDSVSKFVSDGHSSARFRLWVVKGGKLAQPKHLEFSWKNLRHHVYLQHTNDTTNSC